MLPRYRTALTIAAYHYFRIFASFTEAFETETPGGLGDFSQGVSDSTRATATWTGS